MTPDALNALNEAAACYGRSELARAESMCRRLLRKHPHAVDVKHLLALIRKRAGSFDDAEQLLQECARLEPRRADIQANLGNLLSALGRFTEAEAAYRSALQQDPDFRPARLGLARTLLHSGKSADALHEAKTLQKAAEDDAEALTIAGSALRALGESGHAEAMLRRSLALNPRSGVTRHNLGALLNDLGRSEEALAELEQAGRLGLQDGELDLAIASTLVSLSRFDEAEARLLRAVQSRPRDARAQRLLARLRFMHGAEDYRDSLEQALAAYPDDVALRITCSQVLRGAGDPEAAARTVGAASDMSDPRLKGELAAVYQEWGRFRDALTAARAAMAADPASTDYPDLAIDALVALGRADEAMPLIEAARRRSPLNQWYVAMEATAARLLGDERYASLYDYDNLVQTFELEPPDGWTDIESFHADLLPVLLDRHRFRAPPLDQSLRHGTQTPRSLLGDPDPRIRAFLSAIAKPIEACRAAAGFDQSHAFRARNRGGTRLAGCWSVRLGPGGFHVNHVHPEGWISSAYYVQVPADARDPERRSGWLKLGEPRFPVPGAEAERFIEPKPGRLVLFPSYMWHGTTPTTGGEPRLTIAFDAVPAA